MSFFAGAYAQIGLAVVIFPAIYKIFAFAEDAMSPEAKSDMTLWLKRFSVPEPTLMISNNIINIFNSIYGVNQFSTKCFMRVTILSILSTIVTMTVLRLWGALFETTEHGFCLLCPPGTDIPDIDITGAAAYVLFIILICVNIPIDFAAAGVTR
ncbi:MAG: hypothetical protein L0Y50_02680 [Beijerinckiaceae bacterium]|nr:hypothetical protein [Beijerinckiaceae bacterium]MCI0735172.1 hypothetical protein [Beijerinckiaceae bacterium]